MNKYVDSAIFGENEVLMSALYGSSTGSASGLRGTGYKSAQFRTLTPQQEDIKHRLLRASGEGAIGGSDYLSRLAGGGSEEDWKQLEAPALRQFGALQGNLASRFSGFGSGARKSSGFQNTMSEAGAGLAEQLQSNRMDIRMRAIEQLMGLTGNLLENKEFETQLLPKQGNWFKNFAGSLLGQGAGSFFGGAGTYGSKAAIDRLRR